MYSATRAARIVNKTPQAIIKAIQSRRLPAQKEENGRYLIKPKDLARAFPIADQDERSTHESGQVDEKGQTGKAAQAEEVDQVEEASQPVEMEQVDKATQTDDPGQLKESDAVDKAIQIREEAHVKEPGQIIEMAHVQKAVQVEEVDQVDQEVADPASDDPMVDRSRGNGSDGTPFPQVELMHLRDQLAEVTAELTHQREYSRGMSDRFGAQIERECRHIAEQIKGDVEAALDHRSDRQMVKLANEFSGTKPTGAHAEAVPLAPELAALQSVLDDVRADLRVNSAAVERIEAKADTRPGILARGLISLALGWSVMSSVYIAGFWAQFGMAELVRYGQISYTALFNLLLSFWPF